MLGERRIGRAWFHKAFHQRYMSGGHTMGYIAPTEDMPSALCQYVPWPDFPPPCTPVYLVQRVCWESENVRSEVERWRQNCSWGRGRTEWKQELQGPSAGKDVARVLRPPLFSHYHTCIQTAWQWQQWKSRGLFPGIWTTNTARPTLLQSCALSSVRGNSVSFVIIFPTADKGWIGMGKLSSDNCPYIDNDVTVTKANV